VLILGGAAGTECDLRGLGLAGEALDGMLEGTGAAVAMVIARRFPLRATAAGAMVGTGEIGTAVAGILGGLAAGHVSSMRPSSENVKRK
jgi:hypothetical protein